MLRLKVRSVHWLGQFPFLTTSSLPFPASHTQQGSDTAEKSLLLCLFSFSTPAQFPVPAHSRAAQLMALNNQPMEQGHTGNGAKGTAGEGTCGGKGRTANAFQTTVNTQLFGKIGCFTHAPPACCHSSTQHRELKGCIWTTTISVADLLI